jgi:hypothetical protein
LLYSLTFANPFDFGFDFEFIAIRILEESYYSVNFERPIATELQSLVPISLEPSKRNIMDADQFNAFITQLTNSIDQLTQEVQNKPAQWSPKRETNLVPVKRFSGKSEEDPSDWIAHFEKAAKANNWNNERMVEIAGGFLDHVAADWYEDTTFAQGWRVGADEDDTETFVLKFVTHFSTIEQQNKWHYEINDIL